MVIREDIINKALNESINEFMIEEGFWGDAWNGIKNAGKNLWNGVKNGVAMYMNNATNGDWNREYNVWAKGEGPMVVAHYIGQWLNWQAKRVKSKMYDFYDYDDDPEFLNKATGHYYKITKDYNGYYKYYDLDTRETFQLSRDRKSYLDKAGRKIDIIQADAGDNVNVGEYLYKYCNARMFDKWVGNRITDKQGVPYRCALLYINKYVLNNAAGAGDVNIDNAIKYLDSNQFKIMYRKLAAEVSNQQQQQGNANQNTQGQAPQGQPSQRQAATNNNQQVKSAPNAQTSGQQQQQPQQAPQQQQQQQSPEHVVRKKGRVVGKL